MSNLRKRLGQVFVSGSLLLVSAGCKTIIRENIISSIDTGVGATVAENKETQLYELKAGYIRSQFYSVPTGKLVESGKAASAETVIVTSPDGTTSQKGKISNAANVSPQMVAGIRSHSGLGDLLLGMDISENFAVGKDAVNSPAAIAMYITQTTNAAVANAASTAAQSASASVFTKLSGDPGAVTIRTMGAVFTFIGSLPAGDYPGAKSITDSLPGLGAMVPNVDFVNYDWDTTGATPILQIGVSPVALPADGFARVSAYRDSLKNSADVLATEIKDPNIGTTMVRTTAGATAKQITAPQTLQLGLDYTNQVAKVSNFDKQFSTNQVVVNALKYFTSIVATNK